MKEQLDVDIVVIALVLTVLVVSGLMYFGTQLSNHKVNDMKQDINRLEVQQRSQMLGFDLATSSPEKCRAMKDWLNTSIPEIRSLRKKVAAYENSRKLENSDYPTLKKRYTNLVIRNMVETRKYEDRCNKSIVGVLYIYSNEECSSCDTQGTILTHFRRKYDENVMIHPVDADLDLKTVKFLEDHYNVQQYPVMVIEDKVYRGFHSKQELENVLTPYVNKTGNETFLDSVE